MGEVAEAAFGAALGADDIETALPVAEKGERMQLSHAPVVLFVGNYGTGKTEVAVNFAIDSRAKGLHVSIADLDLVNPYFRSREVQPLLESFGIRVVAPPGALAGADLPILVPQVRGLIERPEGLAVLDVGGDDVGATVLGSLSAAIERHPHEVWQVVNGRRPFTDTVAGCMRIMREIEAAARLRVTGIVGNTHLMDETDIHVIREGMDYAQGVADAAGVPLIFHTCEERLLPELVEAPCPILPLQRRMLPPWKRQQKLGPANFLLR